MKIRCESCEAVYNLDERLLQGRKSARMECRKCGASITVTAPEGIADSPAPSGEAPAPLVTPGEIDSQESFDRFLTSICEPDGEDAPLPGSAPLRREPPVRRARPALFPRKAAAAAAPIETLPEVESADVTHVVPPAPAPAPAATPPKEPARPARTIPNYTVSRSVVLDPETLVGNRCVAFFPEVPEMEPYRVLRTRILQAAKEKGGTTVMITSALPLEGKTLTAVNLALTFSKAYLETALLVDCDLKQQRVHETLGYDSDKGLGDYVTDGCAVSDMIVWPGVEKLTVISGGRTVSESSELLGSPVIKELVEDMKGRYSNRYVFFDVPPVLCGADALAFAPLVDHILFVVRAGTTPIPEALRALKMLPREKVIGVVLNRQAKA